MARAMSEKYTRSADEAERVFEVKRDGVLLSHPVPHGVVGSPDRGGDPMRGRSKVVSPRHEANGMRCVVVAESLTR